MLFIKNRFYLCLAPFLVASQFACSPKLNTVPKNEYGLAVVAKDKTYRYTIQTDSSKRMVSLTNWISPLITDWKYASTDNFTHTVLYKRPGAYVRLATAVALQHVQNELSSLGLGLKFFDAYRPYSVTKKMWKVVPDDRYAANPSKGSGHNRGAAVDVTLIFLKNNQELKMPTAYDDFSEKAHHNYFSLPEEIIANRRLLKSTMEKYGFLALDTEWWHYFLPNAPQRFELLDLSFRQMKRITRQSNN